MPRNAQLRAPAFVADLVRLGVRTLAARLGISEESAQAAMLEIVRAYCSDNAQSMVYIPKPQRVENLVRDSKICADYATDSPSLNGARRNTAQRVAELAREHSITSQRVYSIVKEGRQDAARARLPGSSSGSSGAGNSRTPNGRDSTAHL